MKLLKTLRSSARGFTLIELLVVIAIIGVLSSVVLASLNTARGKGANAAIKSNLSNMRAQAEIFNDSVGSYGTFAFNNESGTNTCPPTTGTATDSVFHDPTIKSMVSAAESAVGLSTSARCKATASYWIATVPLKVAEPGNITHWCVDSLGASKGVVNRGLTDNDNAGCAW